MAAHAENDVDIGWRARPSAGHVARYVISLPHRTDRQKAMRRELSRIGWEAEFFPAIRPEDAGGFPSIGARGCFLSHLAVLRQAMQDGTDRLVILEDDLSFVREFSTRWPSVLAELEAGTWDLFYPGHVIEHLPDGLSRLDTSTGVRCTHFMMINGPALPTLVSGLETILSRPAGHPLGGPMHVDGAYSTIRSQHPELATLVHGPALGFQRPSRTDICAPKWFDRLEILAPIVGFARNVKGAARRARRR
jgi:glycosyl transferase, family 25